MMRSTKGILYKWLTLWPEGVIHLYDLNISNLQNNYIEETNCGTTPLKSNIFGNSSSRSPLHLHTNRALWIGLDWL